MAIVTVLQLSALLQIFWLPVPNPKEPTGNRVFIRKNVSALTQTETHNLYSAVNLFLNDERATGYANFSAFHDNQSSCTKRSDGTRSYCATHGKATYLLWNRLYLAQLEQALASYEGFTGLFYYDWTSIKIPMNKMTFISHYHTKNFLLEGALLALEQDDYCRFAIMLEMALIQSFFHTGITPYRLDDMAICHYTVNTDRMFALWQQLQDYRGRRAAINCALNLLQKPLGPFDRVYSNRVNLSRINAEPMQLVNPAVSLGYHYDDLSLNGMNISRISQLLQERRSKPRSFASFQLRAIKASAKFRVLVCVSRKSDTEHLLADDCSNDAGSFFVLGGDDIHQQKWNYGYPYLFEITDVVKSLGVPLDGDYYVHADISALNGTQLKDDIIPPPTVSYIPGRRHANERKLKKLHRKFHKKLHKTSIKRKNVNDLTKIEQLELRLAMVCFAKDKSMQGYQILAEYSGLLKKCPQPESTHQRVCRVHGNPVFLHWNRLAVKQFENSLGVCGTSVALPYWDWTDPVNTIPLYLSNHSFYDPDWMQFRLNPFSRLSVDFMSYNEEAPRNTEWITENLGDEKHGSLFSQLLLAFEQEDFCDFEIQLEVLQNSFYNIFSVPEFPTLDHMSFDPLFWMHSNQVDRLWATWQALQVYRGLSSAAHCIQSDLHRLLKPFSDGPPINTNLITFEHSTPDQVHDYRSNLHYEFESLNLGADMSIGIPDLYTRIEDLKKKDRVFIGFLLRGIKTSAKIQVAVNENSRDNVKRSVPMILASILVYGSREENDWGFDRYYKHEITHSLLRLGYNYDDKIHLNVYAEDINGTTLPDDILPEPVIIYVPNKDNSKWPLQYLPTHERKLVDTLTSMEEVEIREAMRMFKADKTATGFQRISAMHGSLHWCPYLAAPVKHMCCHHNSKTFLPWHRLLMMNFDDGLRRYGHRLGTPYWDWTRPFSALPKLATEKVYRDLSGKLRENPFLRTHIDYLGVDTVRDVEAKLFHPSHRRRVYEFVLNALEHSEFERFQSELEHVHNLMHVLVGGWATYSMSCLAYAAYDPIFYLHHSMVDRVWAVWQEMHSAFFPDPSYGSPCPYGAKYNETLSPFNITSANVYPTTWKYSLPWMTFDYGTNFQYGYDSLTINGKSVAKLSWEIQERQRRDRWFIIAYDLKDIKESYIVRFYITPTNTAGKALNSSNKLFPAGEIYVFSGKRARPWETNVTYRIEITDLSRRQGLWKDNQFVLKHRVFEIQGEEIHNVTLRASVVFVPRKPDRRCNEFAGRNVCSFVQ
ncbi:hemocyanin subunit 1 [Octopus vulgaris]|uniref:Hemocyanin subunit 1 n=1 Tax=Octopus vulgaris TaxID=6645 RepID=A0AA36BZK9_OCTVU|nr:hemocyanin subunit 1 [Octopus vulgaris]